MSLAFPRSDAHGRMIHHPAESAPTLRKALEMQGPVVVGIPVDYRHNHKLMEIMRPDRSTNASMQHTH